MQILIRAEWRSYDSPLHFDKEIQIAGLLGTVEFRGDVYEWRVREAGSEIDSGWVDSMDEAVKAAEAAIRKVLE